MGRHDVVVVRDGTGERTPTVRAMMRALLRDRRLLVLFLAGVSSGLPLLLVGRCLRAWLTTAGADDITIAQVGLVALPYSCKFLWAPVLDRVAPPGGRRRGWLGWCSVGLCLGLAALAHTQPGAPAMWWVALAVAVISATQDATVDALRVESVPAERQGAAASAGLLGYRTAVVLTGGAGFAMAQWWSWPTTYLVMAVVQSTGLVAAWWIRDERAPAPSPGWAAAIVAPVQDLLARHTIGGVVMLGLFAVVYKLGDALAAALSTTFVLRHGFTQADIGLAEGTVGIAATILGVVLGGLAATRWPLVACLVVLGAAQSLSNLAYAALAQWGGGLAALMAVLATEHLAAGLATPCFVAFLSRQCAPGWAATQYAVLSCAMAAGRDGLASSAGACRVYYHLDWPAFFIASALVGLPGLLLLWPLARGQRRDGTAVE